MTATATARPAGTAVRVWDRPNPHADAWKQFCDYTTKHELVVIHDDGPYKHLRMQEPGTGAWHWDVITWPGHLCIDGDIDSGHVFSRDPDMLDFFRRGLRYRYPDGAPSIDFRYWAEKLARGSSSVKTHSEAKFLALVRDFLDENLAEDAADVLVEAARVAGSRDLAFQWLYDTAAFNDSDVGDWDLNEWDHHFVLACYAVAATVDAWGRHTSVAGDAA